MATVQNPVVHDDDKYDRAVKGLIEIGRFVTNINGIADSYFTDRDALLRDFETHSTQINQVNLWLARCTREPQPAQDLRKSVVV